MIEYDKNPNKPLMAYSVMRLDRLINQLLSQELKSLNITLPQYASLSVLATNGSLSNAQLAEHSFIKPQSANKILQDLSAANLIKRQPDPAHGRIILISLTEKGQNTLQQCHLLAAQIEAKMLQHLDIHLINLIQDRLEQMVQNLRAGL